MVFSSWLQYLQYTYYLPVCYLFRIQQYSVNITYNTEFICYSNACISLHPFIYRHKLYLYIKRLRLNEVDRGCMIGCKIGCHHLNTLLLFIIQAMAWIKNIQLTFSHLNTYLVWFSDPHCTDQDKVTKKKEKRNYISWLYD